jgi:hypothetical protein
VELRPSKQTNIEFTREEGTHPIIRNPPTHPPTQSSINHNQSSKTLKALKPKNPKKGWASTQLVSIMWVSRDTRHQRSSQKLKARSKKTIATKPML